MVLTIGIDLGATNTRVAVFKDGAIELIPNEHGNKSAPSCVKFTNTQQLIGESALDDDKDLNLQNIVYGVKCLIGRKINDRDVKKYKSCLPYRVVDSDGKLAISVEYKGERRTFEPEEITSMILGKVKDISQSYLGVAVEHAVITVPVHFNYLQRQAVTQAAHKAGFRILEIMNETTAGIYAFGLHHNVSHERNVLLFHLGGCTCNVTIVTMVENCGYYIKATTDSILPGINDLLIRLIEFFVRDFGDLNGIDITGNKMIYMRLRRAAEKAVIDLSSYTEATIYIDAVCDGKNYFRKISRARFEELCSDLFENMKVYVQQILKTARMQSSNIYKVILMGGGTKLYKIQNMMIEQFNGRILATANPDQTVVYGAAIQAAMLSHDSIENIQDLFLVNLIPLSLGVEICKGVTLVVIERNTPMPCTKSNTVTTFEDYQTELPIKIYEGERSLTKDNNFLGTLILTGITPAPRGIVKINVVFNVSASGILFVQATDRTSGSSRDMIIPKSKRFSSSEISRNIADSRLLDKLDRENKLRLEARDALELFVYITRRIVADDTSVLTKAEKEQMCVEFEDALNWLKKNCYCHTAYVELKYKKLLLKWSPLITKLTYHECSTFSTLNTSDNRQYQYVTSQPGPSGMQQQRKYMPDPSGDLSKNIKRIRADL